MGVAGAPRIVGSDHLKLTLAADSTTLSITDGEGRLDMQGTFRFPSGTGLIKDKPDTVWKDTAGTKKFVSADSTITLRFSRARLGTDGEVSFRHLGALDWSSAEALHRIGALMP